MHRTPFRSLFVALATLAALALSPALAQDDDPVLVRLGSVEERASFVFERFEIAVRGLAAGQGMVYGPELLAEVYPFYPQFLEQRAGELVLLEQARVRGLVVDEAVVEAVVDQARGQFPDEATLLEVLAAAGFRDLDQLRELVRETELIQAVVAEVEAEVELSDLEVRVAYESLRPQLVRPEEVCARHILVESELAAAALGRAARVGADFAAMAATASANPFLYIARKPLTFHDNSRIKHSSSILLKNSLNHTVHHRRHRSPSAATTNAACRSTAPHW
ncbi:MAG: hypothetical protein P1P87_05575 [Trueperaceae bacterium]|nr:hypothetical protein [Trueperaceae bacterium]